MSTESKSGRRKAESRNCRALILVLAGLLLAGVLAGCKSPESSENEASRPWNAPRQWETGLPGFNQYDRR